MLSGAPQSIKHMDILWDMVLSGTLQMVLTPFFYFLLLVHTGEYEIDEVYWGVKCKVLDIVGIMVAMPHWIKCSHGPYGYMVRHLTSLVT